MPTDPVALIPPAAQAAFAEGQDKQALTLLRRERDLYPPASPQWAYLERLSGLVLIHLQREVEGTFALEKADPILESAGWLAPTLEPLEALD